MGAVIAGISTDPVKKNKKFADKMEFQYPLLSDLDGSVCRTFGAITGPGNQRANRISVLVSPEGKVSKVWGKVNPLTHAGSVLEAIEAEKAKGK